MAYKGLILCALLFVCAVSAERFALLSDLLARYDPYTGKIRNPVHLNYGVDTSIKFKGIVIPKHCNVYEGPAVSHKVVGVLSQFDKVQVVGEVVFTESGEEAKHAWYQLGPKKFVMEHYIFNRHKANVEDSESSEYYSDVKTDFNHVEAEKPAIEEIKELPETTPKESMEDMAAQDTTDQIVNEQTDGTDQGEPVQAADNNEQTDDTQQTDGTDQDEPAQAADNNEQTDDTQQTGENEPADDTQQTDGTDQDEPVQAADNNKQTDDTQQTDGTDQDEPAQAADNNKQTDDTQQTGENEQADATQQTDENEPADQAAAGDIFDEEADG